MDTIVHIGYHKTATTWFQKQFYPCAAGHVLVPRRQIQQALLAPSAFHFDPARARAQLGLDRAGPVQILCEEELSGNPHSAGMQGCFSKDIAERIQRTLRNARIIVFIRNQVDVCGALYRHYVREGGTYGPERYLCPERYRRDIARHGFKYPVFSFDHLEYLGLIDHYRELFGPERVQVYPFEAFRADPPAFIRAFSANLGLEVETETLDYAPENRGLGHNALWLGRLLNHLTYRSVLDKRYCLPLMSNKLRSNLPLWLNRTSLRGADQTPRQLLGPRLVQEIVAHFAVSNRILATTLGLHLKELGYPWADAGQVPGADEGQ